VKVKIIFVSFLKEVSGVKSAEFNLSEDATVKDVLEKIVEDFPKLKEWLPQNVWTLVNGHSLKPESTLRNNDEIALFPRIGGA